MTTADNGTAIRAVLLQLENEARDLETRLAEVRGLIKGLRKRAPFSAIASAMMSAEPAPRKVTLVEVKSVKDPELPLDDKANTIAAEPHDTVTLVLQTIRSMPGLRSAEVADLVQPDLKTDARNPRKLVHSTLSYLLKRGLVTRQADGTFLPTEDN